MLPRITASTMLWASAAFAQAPAAPAPSDARILPAKTAIVIAVDAEVDSKANARGDMFAIRLVDPIRIGDEIVVPAGTMGRGEVVHAARARAAGKAGELIVNARYLECGSVRIPLGYFKLGGTGERRGDEAFAASMVVTPLALVIAGGERHITTGATASAKTTADVALPPKGTALCGSEQPLNKGDATP